MFDKYFIEFIIHHFPDIELPLSKRIVDGDVYFINYDKSVCLLVTDYISYYNHSLRKHIKINEMFEYIRKRKIEDILK